jgi:uncharacterized protein GlcG (DUF336 family)
MDGVQIGSIVVAQEKAISSVRFKRPTKALSDLILEEKVKNKIPLLHYCHLH